MDEGHRRIKLSSYKRRIYLINPRFQLKFSLYVCFMMFISSLLYPVIIYDMTIKYIPEAQSDTKIALILVLALWHLGITSLVFITCIFFSHKIAGPIYKTRKYLEMVKNGGFPGKLFFRKGDYFPELADDFNSTMESVQDIYKRDFVYISEVNTYLNNLSLVIPDDKRIVLDEIRKKLVEIQGRFEGT